MKGTLPVWLADWLCVAPASNTDAATWQLDTAWRWAPWATLLLVLGATAWTVLLYARESTPARPGYRSLLISLRLTAIAIVLAMLAQWALALRLTGPPTIAVIIDRSASMGIADRYDDKELIRRLEQRLKDARLGEPTRLNLAKLLTTEQDGRLLRELADRFRLEVYFAAESVEHVTHSGAAGATLRAIQELSSTGQGSQATRLGDAVRQVLEDFRGTPPAAVILFSDGITTRGAPLASAAEDARRKGVPIIAVGLGSQHPSNDIELADVLVDDAIFVNDLVSFQAQVKASGLEGQQAKVTLRHDGDAAPLAETVVTLPARGQTLTTRLVDRPAKAGDLSYVVEVAARDDEFNKQNNRQSRRVSVRDDIIRVLLVQGYPSFEFRYLKTLLERDRSVQLRIYLQDADPEFADQDKSALRLFPMSQAELMEYDVILIGDVDPRLLPRSAWQNVRKFITDKGGGLAFVAGPRHLPWLYRDNADVRTLLPIEIESAAVEKQLPDYISRGFIVRPTPLGLQSPALQLGDTPAATEDIWNKLAPLYWLANAGDPKPAAQVLAGALALSSGDSALPAPMPQTTPINTRLPSEIPLILFQYVGPGRVLYHAIDSTWRWRQGGGDTYFTRYWVQTIRFLARGKLRSGRGAILTADRREYRRGDTVALRARFFDSRLAPTGDEATVLVDAAGQVRRRVTLRRNPAMEGVFEGAVTNLPDGQYEAVLEHPPSPGIPPATPFSVVALPGELAETEMDAAALAFAAETTRGKFYTIADVDRLPAELPAGRRVPRENLPPIPLWNRSWLLMAFLSCITGEWILRKRKGMM